MYRSLVLNSGGGSACSAGILLLRAVLFDFPGSNVLRRFCLSEHRKPFLDDEFDKKDLVKAGLAVFGRFSGHTRLWNQCLTVLRTKTYAIR
jgi:hypothetical protein